MEPIRQHTTTRRLLPHIQDPGRDYFVPWRTRFDILLAPEDRSIVLAAVRFWHEKRWFVYAAVVMPDHVHVLCRPLPNADGFWDLGIILHSVKGYSAQAINGRRGRRGSVWQDERFDRVVRDEREFDEIAAYIRDNPVTAGLVGSYPEYEWLYSAESR